MAIVYNMATLVANKLWCYVQNNVPKHPRTLVGVAINGFYSDDEVACVKMCLHGIATDMKIDGLTRFIRRQGDKRRKLEYEDIISISLSAFVDGVQRSSRACVARRSTPSAECVPGWRECVRIGSILFQHCLPNWIFSLYCRMGASSTASSVYDKLKQVIKRLDICNGACQTAEGFRKDGGCCWDKETTEETLIAVNELYDHLMSKDTSDVWSTWSS